MNVHHLTQPRRHGEPPAHDNPHSPQDRGDGAASLSTLPENWPVGVTRHSWVMTIVVIVVIAAAGAFVFSLCHAERTAQAASHPDR